MTQQCMVLLAQLPFETSKLLVKPSAVTKLQKSFELACGLHDQLARKYAVLRGNVVTQNFLF